MGTDIQLHVEIELDNQWHHWATPSIRQNYQLFGKMAGVRGIEDPITKPKGLPNDITLLTTLDYQRSKEDAHTASWLNRNEIEELSDWLNETYDFGLRYDLEFGILHTYLFDNGITELTNGVTDVRLVFWFIG